MPKLSELCAFACHSEQPEFLIPPPGALRGAFCHAEQNNEQGVARRFYAVHPKNHDLVAEPHLNPAVAIVGLSAADTQIEAFLATYARTKSYDKAARDACFKGLANDIIVMLEATGAAARLGLRFDIRDNFNGHDDVLCDSLVKCASLDANGRSTDWTPGEYGVAKHCVTKHFVANMTDPRFTRLETIILLGTKSKKAIETIRMDSGRTVRQHIEASGKKFHFFPHPSGGNREYVELAKQHPLPDREPWITKKWDGYRDRCRQRGEEPVSKESYCKKRRTTWGQINDLRAEFGR